MVARGSDEATTGRTNELHMWVYGYRIYGLCRADGGIWVEVLGRLRGVEEIDWAEYQDVLASYKQGRRKNSQHPCP